MFVVAGVTGHTGSVVAETLLARRQPVRVIVRAPDQGAVWRAKGAEVALASLEDPAALAQAFQGAQGAYLLVPPNYGAASYLEDREKVTDAMVKASKAAALTHVVFLSSVGAHLPAGTGPIRAVRYGEGRFSSAVPALTVLRPPSFFENWAPFLGAAKTQGILPSFLAPSRKIPMISTRDIGRIAADSLLAPGPGRAVLELSGPKDYSPQDVASAAGRLLGRTVAVQHLPLTEVVPTFTSFGFSEDTARLFEEMYAGFEAGTIVFEGEGTTQLRGKVTLPEALAQWL